MKHILAILVAFCAIGYLSHSAQAAQENHVASIRADGIHTIGTANSLASPSCCVFPAVTVEGRVRAPDNPAGFAELNPQIVIASRWCSPNFGQNTLGTIEVVHRECQQSSAVNVSPLTQRSFVAWSSPAPYDPVATVTTSVNPGVGHHCSGGACLGVNYVAAGLTLTS